MASGTGDGKGGSKRRDFYEVLGVERTATESEIKNAYRKAALRCHPDKHPEDEQAAEKFKELSIAYSVLSDPNKRRQYDLTGPSGDGSFDFEGLDVSEMSNAQRMFAAVFSSMGVPIPTQIGPQTLSLARKLADKIKSDPDGSHRPASRLRLGERRVSSVLKQEISFFTFAVTKEISEQGVILLCHSADASRFKMVLFDSQGSVRQIEEGLPASKLKAPLGQKPKGNSGTDAQLYFVPFARQKYSELNPMQFAMQEDSAPIPFLLLAGLESAASCKLEPRTHLVGIYGDNWFQSSKFEIQFLTLQQNSEGPIDRIADKETKLAVLRKEMSEFQKEFMEIKAKLVVKN